MLESSYSLACRPLPDLGPISTGGWRHAVFCSARAIENGLPHVYVNQVGPAGTLNFVGGSTVVSADGEVRAQASSSEEELPIVSLLLPERSSIREDYLKELRSPMPGVRNVISGAESVTRIET